LVLGEGAVTADFANWAPGLESFVEAGGRLVCMAQTTMPRWLPLPVALCGKNASPTETSVFVRAAPHPVTRGFDLESLRFWRDDHVVVRRSLLKPKKGNAIPIADSNLDLVHSPLLELPHGKGVYLLCQALAVEAFEREPMAPVLLANLLEYADTRPQSKWVKTAVMADRDSPLVRALRDDLKADFACIEPTGVLPATHALIVIDAQALVNCNPDRLRHRVDMGATVLVQAVCPDARGALASLLEEDVQVTKAETRPVRFVADQPETVGLSNFDLDWKDKSGRRLSHSRLEYTVHVSSDAATDLTDLPGSLFRVVRGTGRVLVNQFRWPTERHDSEAAQRFASILLTNLGVPMTSLSLVPVSAKGWFFVDIAPFCNARLRHASGNDLRDLPTGQTEFRDIPFFVMPHDRNHGLGAMHLDNVLALDDGTVLGKKDAPVTELRGIRVRKHVGRMAFLHAAGFNHGLARYQKPRMAEYIINYRGGSREVVPVRAGKEVVNWWTDWAADLPNAKLAWKGANLKTDNIAVFMTEWANPFPERLVETVDFVSCSNPAWGPTCIAISGLEIE